MALFGYKLVCFTPGLWKHDSNGINFTLVVDDFSIKYTSIESIHYLITTLKVKYDVIVNMEGNQYIGVSSQ